MNIRLTVLLLLLLGGPSATAQRHAPPRTHHSRGRITGPVAPPVVYTFVDQPAEFRGDLAGYYRNTLNYPVAARENGIEGKAVILFEVDQAGKVRFLKFRRSTGFAPLDSEARRIIIRMPAWKPAKVAGVPVRSLKELPVIFRLD